MSDPAALSDTWTWRGPVVKSSPAHLSQVVGDGPARESTTSSSNACEWVTSSPYASSQEYGSDLDDAITMSLSECSSGGGGGNRGGTGGGVARRDGRSHFDQSFAFPYKKVPESDSGRVKSAEGAPYHRGGSITTQSLAWAPFSGVRVKDADFLDQHKAATVMVQHPPRLRSSATSSTSTHSRPDQGHRSSLRTPRLPHFFPDNGNISSSSSSADDVLKRVQAEIWDDIVETTVAAQKRLSEGRRGGIDSCSTRPGRPIPHTLLAKAPCAAIGILRGRDERRRRQRRQRQREQQRWQVDPGVGHSDSDEEAKCFWARQAGSILHSESREISPSSRPTLPSPLNCKVHAFETLRSAYLSPEPSATAEEDGPLGQENEDSEGSAEGTTTSNFPPTTKFSSGQLLRHNGITHGSWERRLPADDAQLDDPRAPQELRLTPVEKIVREKDIAISAVGESGRGTHLIVAADHRAAVGPTTTAGAEGQPLEDCCIRSPAGAHSLESVVGFGLIGSRLRASEVAVTRVPAVVDLATANTVDKISHGSLVPVAAASPSSPPPPSHNSNNSVYLSCSRPKPFQRLPEPRTIGASVAVAAGVAETGAGLGPLQHMGGGGGTRGNGGVGGVDGIQKRGRRPKYRKKQLLDNGNGRGFRFGYGYDRDYDDFRAMWSPGGGAGGARRGEEGGRGERSGSGGTGVSGALYSHRGCGKVEGRGHANIIWPSSPSTSAQQQNARSGSCPQSAMIWIDDSNDCVSPPPPPSLPRLNKRRLWTGSRVRVGKGLSRTSTTALEVFGGSGLGDFVGARTAPSLSERRKEDERHFRRVCTNISSGGINGNNSSFSNSNRENRNGNNGNDDRNEKSNSNAKRADKQEGFMLTE